MTKEFEQDNISFKKRFKKALRKYTKKESLWKALIVVSSLALIAMSVLPYVL